jgi:hypothetical protein
MVCFQTFYLSFPSSQEEDWKTHVLFKIYRLRLKDYNKARVDDGSTITIKFTVFTDLPLYAILPPIVVTDKEVAPVSSAMIERAKEIFSCLISRDKSGYEVGISFSNPPDCVPDQLPSLIRHLVPDVIDRGLKMDDSTYYVGSSQLERVYYIQVDERNKLCINGLSGETFDIDDGFLECGNESLNAIVKEWRQAGDIRCPIFAPTQV